MGNFDSSVLLQERSKCYRLIKPIVIFIRSIIEIIAHNLSSNSSYVQPGFRSSKKR